MLWYLSVYKSTFLFVHYIQSIINGLFVIVNRRILTIHKHKHTLKHFSQHVFIRTHWIWIKVTICLFCLFVFFFLFLSFFWLSSLVYIWLKIEKRVIKDERFSVGIEPEDDSLWLPAQLLRTTSSVLVQGSWATEETLVNILRLFLSMACSPSCTLNGRLLIEILSKCGNYHVPVKHTKECSLTCSRASTYKYAKCKFSFSVQNIK